jgi:hypothetical protein
VQPGALLGTGQEFGPESPPQLMALAALLLGGGDVTAFRARPDELGEQGGWGGVADPDSLNLEQVHIRLG